MDRQTVFTKTAKGLMEATGKTSVLSRDMRALLKEIDGKATLAEVQAKFSKVPEAKLQEALRVLIKNEFIREFEQRQTAAPPPSHAEVDIDLDFTMAIPTIFALAEKAEEEARQKVQAAVEAAARAKAGAAARAKAEADARAKDEGEARAKAAAAAAARAKAETEARVKRDAVERARREAEEKARKEAAARAKAEEQARIEAEARARKEAEEKARREADELRARLEEERKAKEKAERERKEAEEKARQEADELHARLKEERKAREDAERKAKEDAERRAREEAERQAREEAERERKDAEEEARREAEEQARREAEERARAQEQARIEAEARARQEAEAAERRAREEAERQAREAAERERKAAEEEARREAEGQARREAEERAQAQDQARIEAEARARQEAEEAERRAREEAERQEQEAAEHERKEAEEKAAREAVEPPQAPVKPGTSLEDLVRIENDFDAVSGAAAEVQAQAAQPAASAEDAMLGELEAKARKEAEAKAASEAEEKARKEAQAAAERAEEARSHEDDAERQQERIPEEAGEQPAAYEREHAEQQVLLEAQDAETERHFAEMEKELEAEQAAATGRQQPRESREPARGREKEEARERVRAEAAVHADEAEVAFEEAPVAYRTPINWGKPVALGLFLILVLGLVGVHFVSFDGSIPQFEKLAGAHLQQPVKIKALHLSLVPLPHWRMEGVSVGNEGQLSVARVNAITELGSMFSDKKVFTSIELESPVLGEAGLPGLLFGKPAGQDFKVANVIVRNGKLNSKTFILPALDAKISVGEDGAWRQIALETPDHKTSLLLTPEGQGAQLEVETNAFSMPFDPSFILENFNAKGVIRRGELRLSEFKGGIYGGYLSGNASLKWGADWSLSGEINARAMDPGRFAPALVEEGKLEGKAVYAMHAKSYDELFAAPRLEGSFAILKGAVLGVDLGRLLQGGAVGGKTAFTELTGSFVREAGKTQLRQIHLGAGPVSAGGSADADAGKRISGRLAVEMKSPVAQARANLAVSGTLREPRFSR